MAIERPNVLDPAATTDEHDHRRLVLVGAEAVSRGDDELRPLRPLVTADAEHCASAAVGAGFRRAVEQWRRQERRRARRGDAVEAVESARHLLRRHQEMGHRIDHGAVDRTDLLDAGVVEGRVDEAGLHILVREVVEDAEVVVEERQLVRMANGPRARLRADHDVGAAHLELAEPLDHAEVAEVLGGVASDLVGDRQPVDQARVLGPVDGQPAHGVSGRPQVVDDPVDHHLEPTPDPPLRLGDRDVHPGQGYGRVPTAT